MLYADIGLVLSDAWAYVLAEEDSSRLEGLVDLLLDQCPPKQRAFATDKRTRLCALIGRGGGKTTGGRVRFVIRMLRTPGAKCLYLAATRDQAEKLMWAPLKVLCHKLGIPAKFREDSLRCTFLHNGATLSLAGADDKKQIEKYRGLPHHEVGIDECASFNHRLLNSLVNEVIIPRLGDYDGTLWMIGTPGKVKLGEFYECTRPNSEVARSTDDDEIDSWDGWVLHRWTLLDQVEGGVKAAKSLWSAALREKRRKGWSDDHPIWLREYMAVWASDDALSVYRYQPHDENGKPFNQWDPPRHPSGMAVLPKGKDNYVFTYGMDLGHSDPFALQIFAYEPGADPCELLHVYEFEKREMHARKIAKLLLGEDLDAEKPGGTIGETGWPDDIMGDISGSGKTLLEELNEVYGIRVKPAPRSYGDKRDAIELFVGDLQDGRTKILKGSKLEEQLSTLQWASDEYGELREDKSQRNDCADAAIYARLGAKHLLVHPSPEERPYFRERKDEVNEPPANIRTDDDFDGLLDDDSYFEEFEL